MPCFFNDDQGTQRRTCRVLTAFCLAALAPFVLFVFIAAIGSGSTTEEDGQAEATTGGSNNSASRIPLVIVTLLWVVVAVWTRRASAATRNRRCPAWTQRFGEWPDFCQLAAPAMFVLCICFFISAVAGDDAVPVGSHGLLPVSMIPLFVASALGCCAGCCACYGGFRNNWDGWASSSEAARAAGCVLWIVSGFFTWFMILLGIKIKYLKEGTLPGQAGRVQTGFPYFSVFFPTFLIDLLVFPCAVGFFNRKYHLARHSNNAMEAEKHAAKCTVAGLFSVLWLSSIFVRFLFILDEANLNESWVVVNGGYYDGDVGITFRNGRHFIVEPDSTANDVSRNATFDQVEAWGILTETSDAQYMACILTGNFGNSGGNAGGSQLCGPRYALGIGNSANCQEDHTLKIFDLGQLAAPMRQKAATASAYSRDGASVVGFCASFCLGYSHFSLNPLDGPPSSRYACSCWGDIADTPVSFDKPSILEIIRNGYDPDEAFFTPKYTGRGSVRAMPAFDCLEGASLDDSIRHNQWPRGRLQRLAGSRFPGFGESSILATVFRNTLSEAFEYVWSRSALNEYTPFCLDFDQVNATASGNVPDWGNFDNVDGVGACQDLCSNAKPSDKTVYWIALSGKNCRCGVTLGVIGAAMSGRGPMENCKTFMRDKETGSIINRDFFYYHGTENVYSAIYYNRLNKRWTDMGSDQTSDQSSSGRIASDSGSPLMSQTAITEIGVADGRREDSLPGGVLKIGDRNQTILAGYDEWDLQALSSGPSAKSWIEVDNAICTSRRKIGGCSGQAYTYDTQSIHDTDNDPGDKPGTVCAAESETCFCDDGWVYSVTENDLNGLDFPYKYENNLDQDSKIACTEAHFDFGSTNNVCVCENKLQPKEGSWISQAYPNCQNVRPDPLNTTSSWEPDTFSDNLVEISLGLAEAREMCLQDAKAECTGLVVYPGRTVYDPPSYYFCDAWMCPVTTKSIPSTVEQAVRMPFKRPTVHIALTLPAQQKRRRPWYEKWFIEFELPQCAKLHVSDTVRISYMEHALPFFIAFLLIAGGFVLSLMRRPMRAAQASAYGQFVLARDRQQQRRDAEAKEERDAMREGRRLAHDLVRHGDDGGSSDSGAGDIGGGGKILEPCHHPQSLDKLEITIREEIPSAAPVASSASVSADGQFAQMLQEFVCSRDSQYIKQCLASMSLLFQEEPALGRDPKTKSILIVAAKKKRNEDSSIWTPEVAQEFGATLQGLSLLGRLGITMPGSLAGDIAGSVRSGLARARSMGGRGGNILSDSSKQLPLVRQPEGIVAEFGEIEGGDSV